jgi:coenzyme Q-binding protein COQ10
MQTMRRHSGVNDRTSVTRAAWPRPAGATSDHAVARGRGTRVVKRIHHRWTDLFDLVLDVQHYPAFVPHCRAVKLFSRKLDCEGRAIIVSRMIVGLSALEVAYANRTTGDRVARRIEVEALDGPLSHLHVVWTFAPDGKEWTSVGFSVDYGFDSPLLAAVASRVFDALFADIIGAFEKRAERRYGVLHH